jgi:hypothetical protein
MITLGRFELRALRYRRALLILGGIDPDSGIIVQRSTFNVQRLAFGVLRFAFCVWRDVYTKRIPDRFQAPLEQYGTERVHGRTAYGERQKLNAQRLPIGRVQKALDGHRDDDRAAKNICDLPLGSADR